jgi:hypothetical protein
MLYRIYTQDKNRRMVRAILKKVFPAYSMQRGEGCWEGQSERTLIIDLVGDRIESKVKNVAMQIKRENHQEAVLVERIANKSILI